MKIFVALSGGVDSAVSAYLLKKQGHQVSAGFIRGYNVDGCQDNDVEDAKKVASHLNIPFYVFDFEKEYKNRVVDYLINGYEKGITPNPDVVCNTEIKFGIFFENVIKLGVDAVASGHYAITKKQGKNYGLFRGKDDQKDQSYFLWGVENEKFQKIIFPVGKYKKSKVRKIAREAKLPNAEKKDSQGICFLGKFNFNEFLKNHIGTEEGPVLDTNGNKIGSHVGAKLYTIGQRHGFENFTQKPLYIIAKDIKNNTLTAVHDDDVELYTNEFIVTSLNILDFKSENKLNAGEKIEVYGRCRYRQKLFKCEIKKNGDYVSVKINKPEIVFPAPGQSFVAYNKKGKVLLGGIIKGYEI